MSLNILLDEVPGVRGSAPPLAIFQAFILNFSQNSRQRRGRAPHSRDFVKLLITVILCLSGSLIAQEPHELLSIRSGEAEYKGNTIILTGDVEVDHGIGKITAKHLSIHPSTYQNKTSQFALLKMDDDVNIVLVEGSSLHCQKGSLDGLQLTGVFEGNDEEPAVVFNSPTSLTIESELMEFSLEQSQDKPFSIKQVIAKNHVKASYQQNYIVLADRVVYSPMHEGTLTFTGNPLCHVTNAKGDEVQSEQIFVDLSKDEFQFMHAHGKIQSEWEFKADKVIWNEVDHLLVLEAQKTERGELIQNKQVLIEGLLGNAYADQVKMHYKEKDKKLELDKVILDGHVKLSNRFDGHLEEASSILHYTFADRVEYFPEAKQVLLTGSNGKRVRFYDKVNKVQISAPALKISNIGEGEETVQGIGDVRFSFVELKHEESFYAR